MQIFRKVKRKSDSRNNLYRIILSHLRCRCCKVALRARESSFVQGNFVLVWRMKRLPGSMGWWLICAATGQKVRRKVRDFDVCIDRVAHLRVDTARSGPRPFPQSVVQLKRGGVSRL